MTGRSVPEWIGKTADTAIPPRVRVRVFERDKGRCRNCTRLIAAGDSWEADHIVALANGGQNRESNLQTLCSWCHKEKTATDIAEKSAVYRKKVKHIGVKPKGRGFQKHPTLKRTVSGEVVRR